MEAMQPPTKPLKPAVRWMIVTLLLCALALQTVPAMRGKSPTLDEFAHHIANGYSYLRTHDFRMNPGSPPLSRMWPAIPLVFLDARLPLDHPSWKEGDTVEFAKQFFYHANGDCLNRFVFWSRVPVVILSGVFALVVMGFASAVLGISGGLAALFFYVFSPNILAHSQLATADLMVAFFFFLTLTAFWRYLRRPTAGGIAAVGAALGGAFLSKFSAVILPPILILTALAAGEGRRIRFRACAGLTAVCLFTIWAGYFFEIKPLLKNTPDPVKKAAMYRKVGGEPLAAFAEKVPVPLSTFTSALTSMMVTRYKGTNAYFFGKWSREGWWQYYIVALAIKETIPLLALTILGLIGIRRWRLDRITVAVLLVPIAAFFVFTLKDRAQAGIRYFLPIFPLLFILAAGACLWLWRRRGIGGKIAVIALMVWHAASAIAIFPDHLAYFNELVGGPSNGYKYLRDSNIDWGQDLKGVGVWSAAHGYREVVVGYNGVEDPHYYGIPYRPFEPDEWIKPRATVYAIGAHGIDSAAWTAKARPVRVIGHSFFIYDFRDGVPREIAG